MTAVAVPAGTSDLTDEEILGRFESLGDNCEFGLVQRAAGIEPMGLFRFNFSSMMPLIRALDCDFADIDRPDQVEIYAEASGELMVRIRHYRFQYHTHQRRGEVETEVLRSQQIKRIRFLARKLLDDLQSSEKLFVRKGPDSESAEQVGPLLRALRRHGPVTLLSVVPQDEGHSLGSVEVVEEGLLRGYIDRFAPYDDAPDFSGIWFDVCRGAYRLWCENSPPGTLLERALAPVAGNLIRHADQFGGSGWQLVPRAAARLSDTVRRLHAACAVSEHTLLDATRFDTGDVYRYGIGHGLASGSVYVASIWVWLPADFQGDVVGAVINGFASIRVVTARKTLREAWQRVWVSARLPPGVTSANPSLYVVGPAGARVFSTCWKLELGVQPTDYEPPAPPARPAPAPAAEPLQIVAPVRFMVRQAADGGVYRRAWLSELWEAGVAERLPYLAESVVDAPPLVFGETDFSHPAIAESPPHGAAGAALLHPRVEAYVLLDATVHGRFGVVTCGDMVLAESTTHLSLHRIAGAEWLDESRLRLPEHKPAGVLPAAYHLLTCNLDNYFHWLLEAVARFDVAEVRGLGVLGEAGRGFSPLLPPFDTAWKRQSFALLIPPDQRTLALPDGASVRVGRLLYIPEFAGGGWKPHRALLTVFDRMRAAAYKVLGAEPATPTRRLFISRSDSPNRMLVNEAEVAARAARAGFERVVLDGMGVAEQVRLFAEATHVLAPHGAGLANLVFCRPGAAVCELHMDCYVNWAFRGLAALRGLRYGCLIGPHIPPRRDGTQQNTWRIDPAQVEAVLADKRFIGG